jgi:hypothetical protein
MHCPHCGQQQVSDVIRFCSRCGFPLEGTIQLLANGGQLPVYLSPQDPGEKSPRFKGVRQGGLLFLSGAVVVPVLAVLNSYLYFDITMLVVLAALLLFVGGPMRMLFAALFEEGAKYPTRPTSFVPPANAPQLGNQVRAGALPPASVTPAPSWRPRTVTGELVRPPSVTEHTTRLLNKDTDRQD